MGTAEYGPEEGILLKVVFVGESGVGAKTCFIRRFVDDEFSDSFVTSIGTSLCTKYVTVKDKKV